MFDDEVVAMLCNAARPLAEEDLFSRCKWMCIEDASGCAKDANEKSIIVQLEDVQK